MRKSDLKTGMLVELRRGDIAWVLNDTADGDWLQWINSHQCLSLEKYNDDLTFNYDCISKETNDIIKVYNPITYQYLNTEEIDRMKVIYERKPEMKLTRHEACKMLESFFGGYEIKITN